MTEIQLNLLNFPQREILSTILDGFSNDFEFTADCVFRRITTPMCPVTGGLNVLNFGRIKMFTFAAFYF